MINGKMDPSPNIHSFDTRFIDPGRFEVQTSFGEELCLKRHTELNIYPGGVLRNGGARNGFPFIG